MLGQVKVPRIEEAFDSRNHLPSTALDTNKNKIFEYMKFIKNRKNVHLISMNDMVKLLKDYHDTE